MGLLRKIKTYPNGCYDAQVLYNGKWIDRTMFPDYMNAKEIVDLILDSYKNIKEYGLGDREKYLMLSEANGIAIETVIRKSGSIRTIYPKVID